MGSGGTRPQHRCRGRWVGMLDLGYAAGKRQRRPVYGKTRKEVADKLVKLRRENPATGSAASWTIERWMEYYLAEVVPSRTKPQTRRSYRSVTKTYINPMIGRHRLTRLEPQHVRAMYNRLRAHCPDPETVCRHDPPHEGGCPAPVEVCPHEPSHGLTEKTLRNTHAVLRRALKVAMRDGHIERNVAELVDPPGTRSQHRSPMSLNVARKVLSASDDRDIDLRVHLRLYYGLRQGEVLGLEWAWVDFDARKFRIYRTVQKDDDGTLILGFPKSEKSRRWLPMVTPVEARLKVAWAAHLIDFPGCATQCEHTVFANSARGYVDPKRDWAEWRDLLAGAGLEHYAPHAARNTSASLLAEAGIPQVIAKAVLGHSTVALTADVYTETDLELVRKALEQYTDLIGEAPAVEA